MNLVDNNRDTFGLLFSSKIYSENYSSTVIVNRLLPEFEYSFGAGKALEQAAQHIAIFAYTVNVYLNDSTNEYNPCWNIKHAEKIQNSGLVNYDLALGYITGQHFVEILDDIIESCLKINGNDKENLSRLSAILQATGYASLELALQYSSDDSFTNDMIMRLGILTNNSQTIFRTSEDCEYVLKTIHELPEIYSNQLLGKV